jgi:hypothetical protein
LQRLECSTGLQTFVEEFCGSLLDLLLQDRIEHHMS